jgi:hypothetical protein
LDASPQWWPGFITNPGKKVREALGGRVILRIAVGGRNP